MSGIFQGYANSDGRVRASAVTKVPVGSANDRGMIVAGNRVIPYLVDAGQPRVLHDGIAFDNVTGLLLVGDGTATPLNISMGGLLVDVNGAVVAEAIAPDVVHQGVGLGNDGRLAVEAEPIATFIAHLHNNVASTTGPGTFTRASDGLYLGADGNWRVAPAGVPRFENDRLLMEPARTNKEENYNANPDAGLTSMVPDGGIVRRVFNPEMIAAAGLSNICRNGYVWEFENNTGGTIYPYVLGLTGNTNDHHASCWMNTSGKDIQFGINASPTCRPVFNTTSLELCVAKCTIDTAARRLIWRLLPGEKIQFVLNGLEETFAPTTPIVTEGASASRAGDALEWADPANFWNQASNMVMLTLQPGFSSDDPPANWTKSLLTMSNSAFEMLLFRSVSAADRLLRYTDSISAASLSNVTWAKDDTIYIAGRASASSTNKQIGVRINNGVWLWSSVNSYSGEITLTNPLQVLLQQTLPAYVSDIMILNEDRGISWIEENYP